MYIFSRTTTAAIGKQREATVAAVAIAGTVQNVTGQEIKVMAAHFGAPQGTIMWTTTVESHAQRQTMLEALGADQGFLDEAASNAGLYMTSTEDRISRFLSPPVAATGKFYIITRASMLEGKYAEAIEFGLEISDYVQKQTGMAGAFLKPSFGGFGDVVWIQRADTVADLDKMADWEMGDAGYQERIQAAAGLFIPNSGFVSMIEQLN